MIRLETPRRGALRLLSLFSAPRVMLGFFVLVVGLVPFVLGLFAWHYLGRRGSSPSDDPPPPPPGGPEPAGPTHPRRCRDRAPLHRARTPRSSHVAHA